MRDKDWPFPLDAGQHHQFLKLHDGGQDGDSDWQFPGSTILFSAMRQEEIIMGDKAGDVPGTRKEERQQEITMADKDWRFPGPPTAPSSSQATSRETRRDDDGRPGLAISRCFQQKEETLM